MALSGLILIIVPVIILALIGLIIVGVKVDSEQGGEDVIRNVYLYLVLFATLMMTIGGSVGVFMAASDIISPAPYYQSFEEYKRYGMEKDPELKEPEVKLSEQEILANYNAMVNSEKERQIQRAKNSLIKSFGWIAIPLPVFIYFQRRLAQKEAK